MTEALEIFFKELQLLLSDMFPLLRLLIKALQFSFLTLLGIAVAFVLESRMRERLYGRKGKGVKVAVADIIHLMLQAPLIPRLSERSLFFWAPAVSLVVTLFFFLLQPMKPEGSLPSLEGGILYLLFAGGLAGYTFFLGGLAGGSRFSFLGALRNLAETFSCQLIIMLTAGVVLMTSGSADLEEIVSAQKDVWYVFVHFPMFVLFMLSFLMLTEGAPFGTSKGAEELSGGIYAEYTGGLYLFFKCADYILLLLGSVASALLFFGGWNAFAYFGEESSSWYLLIKTVILFCLFVLLRSSLPFYKTEDAMAISYKCFLPFSVIWLFLTAGFILVREGGII